MSLSFKVETIWVLRNCNYEKGWQVVFLSLVLEKQEWAELKILINICNFLFYFLCSNWCVRVWFIMKFKKDGRLGTFGFRHAMTILWLYHAIKDHMRNSKLNCFQLLKGITFFFEWSIKEIVPHELEYVLLFVIA